MLRVGQRSVLRSSLAPALNKFKVLAQAVRFALNFNGVNSFGRLGYRTIDPDGTIDIKFRTGPSVPAIGSDRAVISQCSTATYSGGAGKEFTLYFNAVGNLQCLHGGNFFSSGPGTALQANTLYRWRLEGSTQTFWVNGAQVFSQTVTRGSAREPAAQTVLMAQTHGGANTFRAFTSGVFYDFEINGVFWPIDELNQPIQLPSPGGLGAELITPLVLENPTSKGSQWTYLGAGRWQYLGDGAGELTFISAANSPTSGYLEFEVESYEQVSGSGSMRTTATISPTTIFGDRLFNTVGKKRVYFITKPSTISFTRNNAGDRINCVIKNISYKPLTASYGSELISRGDFSNAAGWTVGTNAAITGGELRISNAASTSASKIDVATINGKMYELTYTIASVQQGSVRLIVYGNGQHYLTTNRTTAGTYTELVQFNILGGSFNNALAIQGGHAGTTTAVVDNVSLKEVTSYCNPLTLNNVVAEQWQQVLA